MGPNVAHQQLGGGRTHRKLGRTSPTPRHTSRIILTTETISLQPAMTPGNKNGNSLRRSRRLVGKTTAEESQAEVEPVVEKPSSTDEKDRDGRVYLLLPVQNLVAQLSLQFSYGIDFGCPNRNQKQHQEVLQKIAHQRKCPEKLK